MCLYQSHFFLMLCLDGSSEDGDREGIKPLQFLLFQDRGYNGVLEVVVVVAIMLLTILYLWICFKRTLRKLHRLRQSILVFQEDERKRIAMELHDGICQKVALLRAQIRVSPISISEGRLQSLVDEIRFVSRHLYPKFLTFESFDKSLQILVEEINDFSEILYEYKQSGTFPKSISEKVKLHIYRIVQECLNNIEKHSKATAAQVNVEIDKNASVQINITDDGVGFPGISRLKKGFGLNSMLERIEILNGKINFSTNVSQGSTVHVWVPAL